MPVAGHQMIVDHADSLHEGVDDGRADELETAAGKFFRNLARYRGFRRHLFGAAEIVHLRLAVEKIPEQAREAGSLLHHLEVGARGQDGTFDLQSIAHDAGILHQPLDLLRRIAGDLGGLEVVEGAAKIIALAQYRDPGQTGLEAIENELLVERTVVVFRHAPLLVVIGDIERVLLGPGTALEAVGVEEGRVHSAAFASPGNAKRAQAGLASRNSTPPATSGEPAASASAARSRRSIARPRPCAVEPSVPTAFSPALTWAPASGAKPS